MDISKLDANFATPSTLEKEDIVWFDAAQEPFQIFGAVQTDPYLIMPLDVAQTVSAGVASLCRHTAGVRARFRTDSPYIAIHAEWENRTYGRNSAISMLNSFDLYRVENGGAQRYVGTLLPPYSLDKGYEAVLDVSGKETDYVLNFPLYNEVCKLYIGIRRGSQLLPPKEAYSNDRPVIFYGSSITQGGCASRAGTCYQNHLSRALNMDYVNLGFSGSGRGEDAMIDYLASLEMSAFVSDYDHNAPTPEHLAATHEKLYLAVRRAHPDIPYVMITRPNFLNREGDVGSRLVVMNTYRNAIAAGDRNVYYLDGASLFAGDEWDACTVDGVHPNDLGFYRFFQALLPIMERVL